MNRRLRTQTRLILITIVVASSALLLARVEANDEPPPESNEAYKRYGLDTAKPIESRVGETSADVLEMFKEAGFATPKNHVKRLGEAPVSICNRRLPPLQKRILTQRLRNISFLDGMPNTVLTSSINPDEAFRLFDVTVNAAILSQNASEWATKKERTCFDSSGSELSVSIDMGTKLDALVYVLIHEATHIVDACEHITPETTAKPVDGKAKPDPEQYGFTKGVWIELKKPVERFGYAKRERLFIPATAIPIDEAIDLYSSFRSTPFVSLYGSTSWFDDLAEYAAVYHLTEVLKQPFRIVVRKGDAEIFVYEPMKSELVRGRIDEMKRFYREAS